MTERASIEAMASEMRLRIIEAEDQIEKIQAKGRDKPSQEIIDLSKGRLAIFRQCRDFVQKAADSRAKIAAKQATQP